jgi:hypothetical protein
MWIKLNLRVKPDLALYQIAHTGLDMGEPLNS